MIDDEKLDALEQRLRRLATPQSTDVHTQAADAIAALRAERDKNFDNWKSAEEDLDDLRAALARAEAGIRPELGRNSADARAAPTSDDIKACCEWLQERDESMCHWAAATLRQQAWEIARLELALSPKRGGERDPVAIWFDKANENKERAERAEADAARLREESDEQIAADLELIRRAEAERDALLLLVGVLRSQLLGTRMELSEGTVLAKLASAITAAEIIDAAMFAARQEPPGPVSPTGAIK